MIMLRPAMELLTFLQSRSPLWPEGLSYDGEEAVSHLPFLFLASVLVV